MQYYEAGPAGGPDQPEGFCLSSCAEGQTGAQGVCVECEEGKFEASQGPDACVGCLPPRTASHKGSKRGGACSCPRKSMGLQPGSFVEITAVGGVSDAGIELSAITAGETVAADKAYRLKRLLVSRLSGARLQVFVGGRNMFPCEQRDCALVSAVDLFASRGPLTVQVDAGSPFLQLERYMRRSVTVAQQPGWWDQAEAERLAQARNLRAGDAFFSTQTPFTTDNCMPCPRAFRCGDFI